MPVNTAQSVAQKTLLDPRRHSLEDRCLCPSLPVTPLTEQRQSGKGAFILSSSARMGLRLPKVSEEARALDSSTRGLWLQTPRLQALEDQSSGGHSCPGLWASPCLTVTPGGTPPDAPHQPLAGHCQSLHRLLPRTART